MLSPTDGEITIHHFAESGVVELVELILKVGVKETFSEIIRIINRIIFVSEPVCRQVGYLTSTRMTQISIDHFYSKKFYLTNRLNISNLFPILTFNQLVKYMLDSTLHALADSTRRSILLRLGEKEHSVNEIAEPYEMSLAAVSKHLKVLENANLIKKEKVGRSYSCRMNYEPLQEVQELINEYRAFWEARLDELDHFITQTKKD